MPLQCRGADNGALVVSYLARAFSNPGDALGIPNGSLGHPGELKGDIHKGELKGDIHNFYK
jgi:hypothetical protein